MKKEMKSADENEFRNEMQGEIKNEILSFFFHCAAAF